MSFWKNLKSKLTEKHPALGSPASERKPNDTVGGTTRASCVAAESKWWGETPSSPGLELKTQNSKFNAAGEPSTEEFEPACGHRTGKIARLPRPLRERVNHALYHRWTAKKLVKALNQMPEVKAVLAEHFDGRPVSTQNIYEWKWNGYRDWLHRRQILENKHEFAADARDLAKTAPDMADSLFGMLTLDYADLMMKRGTEDSEQFEKRRKALSTLSQDIVRLYRCRLNARRIQVQETKLENETEKTEEQLHFKFREWTQNPDVRRALILAPMEADRQMRILNDLPPAPEDPLVERETRNDPCFGRSGENKTRSKPDKTKKSNRGTSVPPVPEPQGGSIIQPGVGTSVPTPGSDPENPGNPVAVTSMAATSLSPVTEQAQDATVGPSSCSAESNPGKAPVPNDDSSHKTASPPHGCAPGGEGRGEGELNTGGPKSAQNNPRQSTNPPIHRSDHVRPVSHIPSHPESAPEPTPPISSSTNPSIQESGHPSIQQSDSYAGRNTQELIAECEDNFASEKAARLNRRRQNETGETPIPLAGPEHPPQASKRELSPYEKALLEGKTFIEALYAQFAPTAKPKAEIQDKSQNRKSGWGDGVCEPVHYAPGPSSPLPPSPDGRCGPPLTSSSLRNLW